MVGVVLLEWTGTAPLLGFVPELAFALALAAVVVEVGVLAILSPLRLSLLEVRTRVCSPLALMWCTRFTCGLYSRMYGWRSASLALMRSL